MRQGYDTALTYQNRKFYVYHVEEVGDSQYQDHVLGADYQTRG